MSRCDMIEISPEYAHRCVYDANHYIGHRFDASTDGDGVCMRRSTNVTSGLTRYCSLPKEHGPPCIYLDITERKATRKEMGLPVIPK